MTDRDEWDDGPASNPVAIKARQYLSIQSQIANLDIQAKGLSYEIAREFPAGVGTFTKTFGDAEITLTRAERWSWDKAVIKAILRAMATKPEDPLTLELNQAVVDSTAIHKKVYAKLSAAAQKMLRPALTVGDGPFKIDVEDKAS